MTTTTSLTILPLPILPLPILPFVHCGHDGINPFELVLGCSPQNKKCDWCNGEDSIVQMSLPLSTIIWAEMKYDPFMYIGYDCWRRNVRQNPHIYILDKLVKYITKDIAVGILEYFGDNHRESYMTQFLNYRG